MKSCVSNQSNIMKSFHFLLLACLFLISCNGQEKSDIQNIKNNDVPIEKDIPSASYNLPAYLLLEPQNDIPTFQFDSGVRSMLEDSKGRFWYGTDKDGVYVLDGMSLRHFTIENDLSDNQIRSIQEDKDGNIWFNTGTGICRYNGKEITIMARTIINKSDNKNGENLDWKKTPGDLWFDAGNNNGVYRYDGKELTYLAFPIPYSDSLYKHSNADYSVYSIHEDKDNNIWFGTMNRGVIRYDGTSFDYINEQNLHVAVRSIFQDADGKMWFGNNGGGVFEYDGKILSNLTEEKGLTNHAFLDGHFVNKPGTMARIWAIEQDNDGNIWFGTIDAGVWKYDGKTLTNYTRKDGLSNNAIETIYKDKKGQLWFGTKGAIFRFNGKSFDRFFPVDNC